MAIDKNTLKNFFKTGLRPTQEQFWAWMDSYHHKDEKIPITAIDNIEDILDAKADEEAVNNLFTKSKIYKIGEMQVFKVKAPTDEGYVPEQQAGDYCIGFVYNENQELEFISANYVAGNITLKESYDI